MFKELLMRLVARRKYEYKHIEIKKNGSFITVVDELDKEGKEGWRISEVSENSHISFKALLEREL